MTAPQVKTDPWQDSQAEDENLVPLNRAQAEALQAAQPPISLFRVVAWQAAVALLGVLAVTLLWHKAAWVWSAAAGALAVLLPQALMVWRLSRKLGQVPAPVWLMHLFVWEVVKLVLTLGLLLLAAKLVEGVSWPVLLAAFIFTLKAGWLAALLQALAAARKQNR